MLGTLSNSSPIQSKMPLTSRRRRPHLSSELTNQIEVNGTTCLCFPVDHTWFQGNINTDDESSYSLYGERVSPDPETQIIIPENPTSKKSEENNNNEDPSEKTKISSEDLSDPEQEYYRVTLTDHFTGLSYHLPTIGVNPKSIVTSSSINNHPEETNLFTCKDAEVKFRVENVYKGQKADMVIQRSLGTTAFLGKKCLVYSGPISIVFNEVIDSGRNWCL